MLNALEAAHEAGRTEHALKEALSRLAAYVLFHFSTEEALMEALDDDTGHVAAHMDEHRDFARDIKRLTAQPPSPGQFPALIAFLDDWLARHIGQTDRKLGALVAQAAARRPKRAS
jgi:hemerythrin-like metal-binding protein